MDQVAAAPPPLPPRPVALFRPVHAAKGAETEPVGGGRVDVPVNSYCPATAEHLERLPDLIGLG